MVLFTSQMAAGIFASLSESRHSKIPANLGTSLQKIVLILVLIVTGMGQ